MATNPILGRDVYLALAAIGWADGQLTPEAADAIVRTALEEGLELDEVAQIEEACKHPIDVGVVDRVHMSKSDRLYVYAVASWIAQLDGHVSEQEQAALAKLARQVGVPAAPRAHADAIVRQLAEEDHRPARFDLLTLRLTLDERLEEAAHARAEMKARTSSPKLEAGEEIDEDLDATAGDRPRVDVRFIVLLKPGPNWKDGVEFKKQEGIPNHLEHWRKMLSDGRLDLAGHFLDARGAMMIPDGGTLEGDVTRFAKDDPAVHNGVLEIEIRRWHVTMRKG